MNAFLWFLAVVFFSWLFILFVLPFLGRLFLKKLSKNFQNHVERSQQTEEKPEGSVHIENIPPPPDKKTDVGDYVNYEEINE
jgi:hypothetical protein